MPKITKGDHDLAMSELIESHLTHIKAAGQAAATVRTRRIVLRNLHAALRYGLAWAATDEIETWLATPGWSQWTRCTYAMHIRAFFAWATKAGILDGDPAAEMAHPQPPEAIPRPITDAQLDTILSRSVEPWRTAVVLAAYAGLRCCEIARLRREDITETELWIKHGKGSRPAVIPTHPSLWTHVASKPTGPIILNGWGRAPTPLWVSVQGATHLRRVGVDATMHQLRHWYGTALLRAGNDLRTVQELMRHKSLVSTQGYTKVVSEQRRLAIRTLPAPATAQQSAA